MDSTKFHEKINQFVIDTLTEITGQPPSDNDVAIVTDKITGAFLPGRLPDPQPDGEPFLRQDVIVKAVEKWGCLGDRKAFARTIASQIEGVRKELSIHLRNHQLYHDPAQEELERKVEKIEQCCSPALGVRCSGPSDAKLRGLERKFEKLEDRVEDTEDALVVHAACLSIKPQGVAKCKDEKDEEHDLIRGQSVIWGPGRKLILYDHSDRDTHYGESIRDGMWWSINRCLAIWLRNLSFPHVVTKEPPSEAGGGK